MKPSRSAKTLFVLVAGLVVLIAVAVLIGVSRDDETTEAEWCIAADEFFTEMIAVLADEPVEDKPVEEFIPLERAADTFREMTAPEDIRDDVAVAYSDERFEGPRGDQRPFIRADVAVYGWMLDNCTLSDQVREELSADQEENLEFLDGG